MATFGRKSSQRPAGGGDIFIKNFKEPRTLVWFLFDESPEELIEYKQHFDFNAKRGWPCAIHEGASNCVGCEFPADDETDDQDPGMKVRKTSKRWIVPVVNEKGYVDLYQINYGVFKDLKNLYEEYGTLSDAWYAIRRTQGDRRNDVTYTATKTDKRDKPEVKAAIPTEETISNILGKQYLEAIERYGYDPDGIDTVPDPEPVKVEKTGDTAKDALAQRKAQAKSKGHEPDEAQGGDPELARLSAEAGWTKDVANSDGEAPGWNRDLDVKEAGMGELKDWLDNRPESEGGPIEYPPRAGRPVLQKLVEGARSAS